MSDWKFRRRQGSCGACEKPFAEDERHASVLSIAGDELRRDDLCAACWQARPEQGELFFWFARHHAGRRGLQLDLGTLEQLFLRLEGRAEPRVRELRYLLALLLLRKRRLRIDRVLREADGEALLVHRPRRQEALRVHVFDFTAERMAALRADLVQLLEGAEPSPAGSEAPADPDADAGDEDRAPALSEAG